MAINAERASSAHEYDHLFDGAAEPLGKEAVSAAVVTAAVRPNGAPGWDPATEASRQADIAAADRQNREAAGLPSREYDLR